MTNDTDPDERKVTELQTDGEFDVAIPEHLGAEIERRITETRFDSVDEYVTFVLNSLLWELEEDPDSLEENVPEDNDGKRSKSVEDRLESLGYL